MSNVLFLEPVSPVVVDRSGDEWVRRGDFGWSLFGVWEPNPWRYVQQFGPFTVKDSSDGPPSEVPFGLRGEALAG